MNWKNLLIPNTLSVKDALKTMDKGGEKILFVVGADDVLLGSLTDGDIRRYILIGGKLEDDISRVYNAKPVCLMQGHSLLDARMLMVERRIETLPVVDAKQRLVNAVNWADIFGNTSTKVTNTIDVPVVIMAGGKGHRMDPFTKVLPKSLIPIGEKPIIEIIMDKFHLFGVNDFYVTLNYKGEMVKVYFASNEHPYTLNYIWEKDFLGTAGSLSLLPKTIGDTFIVSNCDIIVDADYADLLKFHIQNKNILTVVGSIQHHQIPYGIIHFGQEGKINRIQEKPEFDLTVNTGVYILSKKAISFVPQDTYFDMPDLIQVLLKNKESVGAYPVSEKSYVDIGQWEQYRNVVHKLQM